MDVQTISVAGHQAQPPPGGPSLGKALPWQASPEMQAVFQSLMASLMAPLMATQSATPIINQPGAAGSAESALSAVAESANGLPLVSLPGMESRLSTAQGTTAAATPQTVAPPSEFAPLAASDTAPVDSTARPVTSSLQTLPQQPMPVDNTATFDALRILAPPQPTSAEGAATVVAQASTLTTPPAQSMMPEGRETAAPTVEGKSEAGTTQTPFAAALGASTIAPGTSVQGLDTAKSTSATPLQQIADQVQVTLDRGENSATIRLQPAELGGVRIRLQVQDGQVHLSIEAEKSGTSRLIDQNIGALRQSLENGGVKVGDLAVLAGGRGHTAGSEAMQREVTQSIRTLQMEMGNNPSQHHQQHAHQQQAAFNQNGQQQRNGGQYGSLPISEVAGGGLPSITAAGLGNHGAWRAASSYAAIDYYA